MMAKMDLSRIASYLFILGLVIAVVAGLAGGLMRFSAAIQGWLLIVFAVLGVVIGFSMSTVKKIEEEVYVIVMLSLALLFASTMGIFSGFNTAIAGLGDAIDNIVTYIAIFSAASIIVLAIRTLTRFHVSKIQAKQ